MKKYRVRKGSFLDNTFGLWVFLGFIVFTGLCTTFIEGVL